MRSFRATEKTNGFICGNGRMTPTKMITRVTWDDKGCTVSIQNGNLQFTTDFTPVLNEMLQHRGKDKIMNQQYYSVEEMQNVLGIGRSTAYNLVHSENFPSITVGKRILIPAEALERWAESKLQDTPRNGQNSRKGEKSQKGETDEG